MGSVRGEGARNADWSGGRHGRAAGVNAADGIGERMAQVKRWLIHISKEVNYAKVGTVR